MEGGGPRGWHHKRGATVGPGLTQPLPGSPQRSGLVLAALILVAAVANLNLAVANVALPDIGKAFDSSQTTLDLIAVGYSLGLAASVLYLGALGDRYGRKLLLVLGVVLSVPANVLRPSHLAAKNPQYDLHVGGRFAGTPASHSLTCKTS